MEVISNEIEKQENISIEIKEQETKIEDNQENFMVSRKSKTGIIVLVVAILIICISIFFTIFAVTNIRNTRIIKGITIGNIDISNFSKEEAKNILEEIYSAKAEKQIFLTHGDFETTITYGALETKYQIENAIEQAYDLGRSGNILKDNLDIFMAILKNKNIKIEVTIDKDMIGQISENINNNIEDAMIQPSYYIEEDKLIIIPGKKGLQVDEKQLLEEVYMVIDAETEDEQKIEVPVISVSPDEIDIEKIYEEVYKEVKNAYYTKEPFTIYPEEEGINFDIEAAKVLMREEKEQYEIPLIITKPSKTVNEIGTEAFPDLLAEFSTKYQASNVNRTTNLKLSSDKISGTVLLPNQEFSYNKTVGERTIAAGYKEAATFSNGKVVNGLGGGICQISSTLYDAVVMANLNVTVRRNHQFVTSYVPAGKDATVVWGSQDFKFVNTRKYPIKIVSTVQGGVATVQIWGVKEEVEYDISIETKKVATIKNTIEYVQDSTLPAGQQRVIQKGSNGRKVEAYKVTRLNGKVVSTTLLSRDTYNPMKEIIHIGTGQ